MKKLVIFGLLLTAMFQFVSCKKKFEYDNSKAPTTNAIVENAFMEMASMSDQAYNGGTFVYGIGEAIYVTDKTTQSDLDQLKANCNVIITIDTVGVTDTITIDWGTTNCTCNDYKTRRGKLIVSYNGSYYDQGTLITYTPVDYYVNDHHVEGSMTVENMGANSSSQPYYDININGVVTLSTGEVATYTSTRVRTFTAGYTTVLNIFDDEYDVTGTANAQVVNGDSYEAHTTSPLHVKIGCPWVTKGVLVITPTGKPARTIDYGNGDCDGSFTVEIDGHIYTVNM